MFKASSSGKKNKNFKSTRSQLSISLKFEIYMKASFSIEALAGNMSPSNISVDNDLQDVHKFIELAERCA